MTNLSKCTNEDCPKSAHCERQNATNRRHGKYCPYRYFWDEEGRFICRGYVPIIPEHD